MFDKVWNLALKGPLPASIDKIGSADKLRQMVHCIGYGIKVLDKRFLLQCDAMTLHRDASDGVLVLRFQAANKDCLL